MTDGPDYSPPQIERDVVITGADFRAARHGRRTDGGICFLSESGVKHTHEFDCEWIDSWGLDGAVTLLDPCQVCELVFEIRLYYNGAVRAICYDV